MIEVIIPLSDIPEGEKVRKLRGTKIYQVLRSIKIYHTIERLVTEFKADNGTVLLSDGSASISSALSSDKAVWITDRYRLMKYLQEQYEEKEDK